MARRRGIITLALIAAMALSHAPASEAQFFGGIVYDPSNYTQNFQTAVHNYNQLIRQAQQLRNEANMLINQAKHLSRLDLNSATDLNRILNEIAYLNRQAENVAYDVSRTRELIRQHFPESYDGLSQGELMVQAEAQFQMSERAQNEAMLMQSKMVESLQKDQALLGQLMNSSHGAIGDLQATQSTNQLMGLLVKQSMQAQQMQVTQARASSLEATRQLALEKEARARRRLFMGRASDAYSGVTP
jgi:P-type conjugative transfer protein TrbJ